MAVGADQGLPRYTEAFEVHLMANPVPRAGETHAVARGDRTEIGVVVRILKPRLQGVMIDIGDRQFGLDLFGPDRLKLQICHGSGRVLRKGLVDAEPDLAPDFHLSRNKMRANDFLCECHAHLIILSVVPSDPPRVRLRLSRVPRCSSRWFCRLHRDGR